MQILAISDVYHPHLGDVATSLRTLLGEIQAKGHAVTLIAPDGGSRDDPSEDVIRVSAYAVPFGPRTAKIMKMHRVLELAGRLRSWNYDVIHVHTPWLAHLAGVALARRLQLPVVETWRTHYEEIFLRRFPLARQTAVRPLARWLTRLHCQRVDGIMVSSTGLRDRLEEYGIQRPITVVPTAIDVQLFQRGDGARFRAVHAIAAERPILLHAGGLDSGELEFLFAAAQTVRGEIPELLFVFAGDGPPAFYLEERARQLGLEDSVIFIGRPERPEGLLDCYRAADCFVAAPQRETQSVPLLEALAAGLPAVTTASVGSRDILADSSAVLVAEDNVPHFSAQVLRVLREPELRVQLAAAAREHSQRWSASLAAEQALDCYRHVIGARHNLVRAVAR